MKNTLKKSLLCLLAVAGLASCGGGNDKPSVAPSSDPTDKESVASAPESNTPESSIEEDIDTSKPIATFHLNYEGDDILTRVNFEVGSRVKLPGDPTRDGYLFDGWFKDAACTEAFDSKTRLDASIDLYAHWIVATVFEAEYVDFNGKAGMGYSANVEGADMICRDDGSANASNGYYVSYLYYNGANLEFNFNAAEAATGVTLVARLSSEFYDMSFDDTNFKFIVNDTELKGFHCVLDGALPVSEGSKKRPFTNFTISKEVTLNAGANKVVLQVNNNNSHGGTMYADAPIVDCIYLGTNDVLTWEPHTENI